MVHEELWSAIFPLVGLSASGLASTGLLLWLSRLRKRHRRKLMARQLWHLCVADVVFCVFSIVNFGEQIMDYHHLKGTDALCTSVTFAYSLGLMTSLLLEAHMAISFTAAMFRWNHLLLALGRSLCFAWPLGAVAAGLEVAATGIVWKSGFGCSRQHADIIGFSLILVVIVLCVFCYICSALRTKSAGDAVRSRVWKRANWYLVVAVVTFGPNSRRILFKNSHGRAYFILTVVSLFLLSLNGLLNALVYAMQASHLRWTRDKEVRRSHISSDDSRSNNRRPQGLAHQGLFQVAFREEERTVFEVSPVVSRTQSSDAVATEPETPSRQPTANETMAESFDSDSDLLLGCFEPQPLLGTAGEGDGGDVVDHYAFPAHIFVVGSPPLGGSRLEALARSSG